MFISENQVPIFHRTRQSLVSSKSQATITICGEWSCQQPADEESFGQVILQTLLTIFYIRHKNGDWAWRCRENEALPVMYGSQADHSFSQQTFIMSTCQVLLYVPVNRTDIVPWNFQAA